MGEFPEPAIRGSTTPASSAVITTTPPSQEPAQPIDFDPETRSAIQDGNQEASATPSSTIVTTRAAGSASGAPSSSGSKSNQSQVTSTAPQASTSAQASSSNLSPSTTAPRTSSSQPAAAASALTPIVIPTSRTSPTNNFSTDTDTDSPTPILSTVATRPIITPSSVATFIPTPETLATNSHLSLGAIIGVVALVLIVVSLIGTCIILGPRHLLRMLRGGSRRDEEKISYEGWEEAHRNSGVWSGGRPASVGTNSDWWRAPTGAFASRRSTVSMAGPGMAGVGAGAHRELDDPAPAPIPRRMSQCRVEERRTVRSGWFPTSMVRGASLLSLGSLVRPPNESSAGPERMDRLGTGGSAGKRFQELYRREKAQQQGVRVVPRARPQVPVSEMGEHRIAERRSRVITPKTRRPSRLAESFVPEIVVHDATHPSLSSVSNVTYESAGWGYDADAEIEVRHPRVF